MIEYKFLSLFSRRLPDFLIQLQNNTESNKTLCDVVGHKRIVLDA